MREADLLLVRCGDILTFRPSGESEHHCGMVTAVQRGPIETYGIAGSVVSGRRINIDIHTAEWRTVHLLCSIHVHAEGPSPLIYATNPQGMMISQYWSLENMAWHDSRRE